MTMVLPQWRIASRLVPRALVWLMMWSLPLQSQGRETADTLRLSLQDAERRFAIQNLQLLASRCGIEAARAATLQAQLWNNPTLSIEQNVYNQETGRIFDFSREGNTEIAIQQLFLLAGKRDAQIRLAEVTAGISEERFADLLRALTLQLRKNFYDLYFARSAVRFYDQSVGSLSRTVGIAKGVYEHRSILLSEVLRLKALLFTLQTERLDARQRAAQAEAALRVLLLDSLSSGAVIVPEPDLSALASVSPGRVPLDSAIAVALRLRPDYRTAQRTVDQDRTNLALQNALAVPDVTVGGRWSRAGGYIPDYYAVSVSIDLPLFNRNQGNIAMAERTLEADRFMAENFKRSVEQEVAVAYRKAMEVDQLFKEFDRRFADDYGSLTSDMITNYEKRNISIIEFTDFFESYRTSMLQMYQLQNSRIDAIEDLNYAVGTTLVRP
jgi:outer membrane protein, heavy metal efflux system